MHTFDRHPYARRTLRIAISRSSLRFVWVCGSAESISCIALCSCGFNNAFPLLCVSRARYERIQWKWKLVAGNFSSSHPTHDTRHELILCACVLVCENGWILIWVSENDNKTCVYVLLAHKTWSVNRMNVVIFRSRIFFFHYFSSVECVLYMRLTGWMHCNVAMLHLKTSFLSFSLLSTGRHHLTHGIWWHRFLLHSCLMLLKMEIE